ncbi:MAG: glycosyltransferase [Deltaproteobacteria bacterium]|nr:glycosyltransferase [Deltaproteobacteria bacterium]
MSEDQSKIIAIDCRKINHYGIGNVVKALLNALIKSKFKVLALGNPPQLAKFYPKVSILNFNSDHNNPFAYLSLRKALKGREIDCLIAPHYVGVWKIEIPLVMYLHDFLHLKYPSNILYPYVCKKLIQHAVRSVDLVLTPSQYTKDLAKNYELNSVSWEILSPPVKEIYLNQKPERKEGFYLAVLSNLKPHKGGYELIKLWKNNFPKLIIAGNVKELKRFERDNIVVLPDPEDNELLELYKKALWLIIPSFDEGYGYCYLESRFTYTPVIARPIPSYNEFRLPCDIICRDFSDYTFLEAIEKSLNVDQAHDLRDFAAIQSKFDGKLFQVKLISILDWLIDARDFTRLDLSA